MLEKQDIAIVGIASRFPDAENYNQFWKNLENEKNSIQEVPPEKWDVKQYYTKELKKDNTIISKWGGILKDFDAFDHKFFHISPREAASMDPQQRLLLEEAWHCIEDSGIPLTTLQEKRTSVYTAVSTYDHALNLVSENGIVDDYATLGNYYSVLSNRLSYAFGFSGSSLAIDAACASSLVVIDEARKNLLVGTCDYALASGVSIPMHPFRYIALSKSRFLSADGQCKVFDIDADGFVPGDGVGVILLKRVQDAVKSGDHIYAIIKGTAVNHSGHGVSITAPNVNSLKDVITQAYQEAGVPLNTITYMEAGSGTSLGDPIEVEALSQVFAEQTKEKGFCKMGSVKTNIGHLEAASGMASLIKILMMLKHKKIPKTLNIKTQNPMIDFVNSPFAVSEDLITWERKNGNVPLRAGINTFGFGGTNAHLVLEEYVEDKEAVSEDEKELIFAISADTKQSMENSLKQWRAFCNTEDFASYDLRDLCYTQMIGRESFNFRMGRVVKSREDIQNIIDGFDAERCFELDQRPWSIKISNLPRLDKKSVLKIARKGNYEGPVQATYELLFQSQNKKDLEKVEYYDTSVHAFILTCNYLQTLMDYGLKPKSIRGTKDGVWVALVLSGMVSMKDACDCITGDKKISQISISRPRILFYDMGSKEYIKPVSFQESYLKIIMTQNVSEPIYSYYVEKARLLIDAQFTFKKLMEEWNQPLKRYGFDVSKLLFEEHKGTGKKTKLSGKRLLLLMIVISSLHKLNKKWNLQEKRPIENKKWKELLNLITHDVLSKAHFVNLALADTPDYWTVAEAMNNVDFSIQNENDYFYLRIENKKLPEIEDLSVWIREMQSLNEPLLPMEGIRELTIQSLGEESKEGLNIDLFHENKSVEESLLDLWLRGCSIKWKKALQGKSYKSVPLPGYCFDREKFGKAQRWGSPVTNEAMNEEGSVVLDHDEEIYKKAEEYLKSLFSKATNTPIGKIRVTEPLERFGIDSVMIMELNEELDHHFGEVSKTLFFEYRNIKELAEYFAQNYEEKFAVPTSKEKGTNTQALAVRKKNERKFTTKRVPNVYEEDSDIAVIGMSGIYPMAENLAEFWENLKNSRDCITEVPKERWDHTRYYDHEGKKTGKVYGKWGGFIDSYNKFDPLFFNISPKEAEKMDPQERLFLQTSWHAMEDAGYTRERLQKLAVGVFAGVMYSEYQLYGVEETQKGHDMALGISNACIPNRVSYVMNLNGPSVALDTMCSSSLTSVHFACESMKRGECEMAFAGGVNLTIHPNKYIMLSQGNFISTDGRCRSFGDGGDGYVPGEGVGILLLKPLKRAVEDGDRIYAVIKSTVINHGGKTNGFTVPSPNAQAEVILKAAEIANIPFETISYVEAHGTGTALGDPIEISGLTKAFGQQTGEKQFCPIGSVKSNIGHLEAAAGVAGITKIILQMQNKTLVPSLHSKKLNGNIHFKTSPFYVQQELTEWKTPVYDVNGVRTKGVRRATMSSFGAGGSNAHIILEEYEQEEWEERAEERQIIVLSAQNKERLKDYARELHNFIEKSTKSDQTETITDGEIDEISEILTYHTAELLGVSHHELSITESLQEMGVDENHLSELVNHVNDRFRLLIPLSAIYRCDTIWDLAKSLVQEYGADMFGERACREKEERTCEPIVSLKLSDIAYTLQQGREAMEERVAFLAGSVSELKDKLNFYCQGEKGVEDFFEGNVKKGKEEYSIFLEDEEGNQFMKSILENMKLDKIAKLWTKGAEIDWVQFHGGRTKNVISLPGYPFAKEVHWINRSESLSFKNDKIAIVSGIHPLLDQNISTFSEQKFSKSIYSEQAQYEVNLNGIKVYFISALLEMARAAGSFSNDGHDITEIKNLKIAKPLVLKNNKMEVQAELHQLIDSLSCELKVQHQGAKNDFIAAMELGKSEIHLAHEEDKSMKLHEIKEHAEITLNQDEYYENLNRFGIESASHVTAVRQYVQGSFGALIELEWKQDNQILEQNMKWNPHLLEEIFYGTIFYGKKSGHMESSLYYLYEVEKMELSKVQSGKFNVFIHRAEQKPAVNEEGLSAYHIEIWNENHRLTGNLTNAVFAPLQMEQEEDQTIMLYEKEWKEETTQQSEIPEGSKILLINEQSKEIGLQLKAMYQDDKVILIYCDDQDNGNTEADYFMNMNDIAQGKYIANDIITNEDRIGTFIDLSDLREESNNKNTAFEGKMAILQEMMSQTSVGGFSALHVTRGLQQYRTKYSSLSGAVFAGFMKVLGAEYEKLIARTIDIDHEMQRVEEIAHTIFQEVGSLCSTGEICYRDGVRYVPCLKERTPSYILPPQDLRDKVMVITGGTRGLGAQAARHFAEKGFKKLVLMGVQELPERARWDEILENNANGSDKIKLFRDLERDGVTLEVYSGKLTDKEGLNSYFDGVRKRLGKIGSVIHCAGQLSDDIPAFIHKDINKINEVLKPKVQGLETLHEVFAKDDLSMFVLYSSISGLMPKQAVGYSDYSAANAYMDFFSAYQQSKGNTSYRSIIWARWSGVGMDASISQTYLDSGLLAHDVKTGLNMLDLAMEQMETASIMPACINKEIFSPESVFAIKTKKKPQKIQTPSVKQHGSIETQKQLKALFSSELKIPVERLEEEMTFQEFGVDSILLGGLVRKVEDWKKTTLDPAIFLEYPTIKSLAQVLDEKFSDTEMRIKRKTQEMPKTVANQSKCASSLEFTKDFRKRITFTRKEKPKFRNRGETSQKIAVIGMACHFPGAENKEKFWNNLKTGMNCITEVPKSRWDKQKLYSSQPEQGKSISKWGGFLKDIEMFDPEYFGINKEEAYHMDPLVRQFLEVSAETFADAGYSKKELWNKKVGVFVGSRNSNYGSRLGEYKKTSITGIGQNFIAAYISHVNNIKGPNVVVDTACSSSLMSIHFACQSLLSEESEMAIAGGVDILLDETPYLILSEAKALSPDGTCHTFDEKANGFVPGEGCGAVMLKLLDWAQADGDNILAVIDATAVNNDGNTMGITTPNPEAQKEVIKEAIQKAFINPSSISYIEAHGTGTMIGDPIELRALTNVFKESTTDTQFCGVGSVKTNIGHLLCAAGIASFIKVVLSLQHKQIPPTIHCEVANPRFEFQDSPFYPNVNLKEWEQREGVRRAGISSFGFGGTNVHVIVDEFTPKHHNEYRRNRSALPSIEFNRKRYWMEQKKTTSSQKGLLELKKKN